MVRELFELHGFFVRQQRKYVAPFSREDDDVDFLVIHPTPSQPGRTRPFLLESTDLVGLERAVVVVKAYHTETFSSALMAKKPEIFRFLEPANLEPATRAVGGTEPPLKILVVPALPATEEARSQSIEILRGKGIDAVILFRTILADLIAQTEANRNYQKSDVLQVIRILKNYDFFREPQLELFKPAVRQRRKPKSPPHDPGH